jgi:hypothetical protein
MSVAPSTAAVAENLHGLQLAYPGAKNFAHQFRRNSR